MGVVLAVRERHGDLGACSRRPLNRCHFDHVATVWPNDSVPGSQVDEMFALLFGAVHTATVSHLCRGVNDYLLVTRSVAVRCDDGLGCDTLMTGDNNNMHDDDDDHDWRPGYDPGVYIGTIRDDLTASAARLITIAAGLVGTDNDSAVCGVLGIAAGLLGMHDGALEAAEVRWTD